MKQNDGKVRKILITIAKEAAKILNVSPLPKIYIRAISNGQANLTKWHITIPRWVVKRSIHYIHYSILHEMAHFARPTSIDHDQEYMDIEQTLMHKFGIHIDYAEDNYPNKLFKWDSKSKSIGPLLYQHSMQAFGQGRHVTTLCKMS